MVSFANEEELEMEIDEEPDEGVEMHFSDNDLTMPDLDDPLCTLTPSVSIRF